MLPSYSYCCQQGQDCCCRQSVLQLLVAAVVVAVTSRVELEPYLQECNIDVATAVVANTGIALCARQPTVILTLHLAF